MKMIWYVTSITVLTAIMATQTTAKHAIQGMHYTNTNAYPVIMAMVGQLIATTMPV